MRQRLIIIITLVAVIVVLVALNAASYVRIEYAGDSEISPDRSTFNSGATGTQAFYDFLHESGNQVMRWRESTSSFVLADPKPSTLVVIGPMKVAYTNREARELMQWVEAGGRLVVVDRNPDSRLLAPANEWMISADPLTYPWSDLDPNKFEQMTSGVTPIKPAQPTTLARNVDSVMPSRFMGAITFAPNTPETQPTPDEVDPLADEEESDDYERQPMTGAGTHGGQKTERSTAPVVHFREKRGALLVDYPYGNGRIVLLSDPYIVANNGISRADNLLLALNAVTGSGGVIAFDEFHQGRPATHNALFQYFSGTPVLAICAQLALIGVAIVWSQGRRFARPLPLPHVDRRSKLEFVASMAELQQRARAHDLALENIYARVRRVLVRYAGVNNSTPRAEIARRVAMRSGLNREELETLMRNCEETINGAPAHAKEVLRMVQRLRDIESKLGLRTRSRDAKQAEKD
ncbi:MAG TPA: DUF4350 domain-containing protein, partial [Pyrinomonadaceae bacterium]|nr:DUF4350 domain-containing protein [Pyrinomonadaceae bacterium]